MYFSILAVFSIFALSKAPVPHIYNEKTWNEAADFLKLGINRSVEPCENFFEHVCGNLGSKNNTGYDSTTRRKTRLFRKILTEAIEKIDLTRPNTPAYQRSVRVFYDQCVSYKNDSKWVTDLRNAVTSRIGNVSYSDATQDKAPNATKAWELAGLTIKEFKLPIFASWRLISGKTLAIVESFALGTSCNDLRNLLQNKESLMLPVFHGIAVDAGQNFNETNEHKNKNKSWSYDILNLCDDLTEAAKTPFELASENVFSDNFSSIAPNFDWKTFSENTFDKNLSNQFQIMSTLRILTCLDRFGKVFQTHNFESIHFLLHFSVMYLMQWWPKAIGNQLKDDCVMYSQIHFGPALAVLYLEHIGKNSLQWRDEIHLLKRNIFAAFAFLLKSADWLDAEDKEKIQKKVDILKFYPGLFDWPDNEQEIMDQIPEYNESANIFENEFSGRKKVLANVLKRVVDGVLDYSFNEEYFLFDVNAFYSQDLQMLNTNLGHNLPPLFDIDYPMAIKYGYVGQGLAHELMHAFDPNNINVLADASDKLKDTALNEYKKQQQCLTQQFSAYCRKDQNLCVNGDQTLEENVADSAGVKIAYIAYKFLSQLMPNDPPVPGMLNYTQDQIFFVTYARGWCNKGFWLDEWLDEHAPAITRVEVALRNVPSFAKALKCKTGSKYAPLKPCSIWADIANL